MCQEKSKALLDLLVQEFQIWQELICLTRAERAALLACDVAVLTSLSKDKQALLNNLSAHQQLRREIIAAVASPGSFPSYASLRVSIQTVLADFNCDETGCLLHLAEGILALSLQIGDLSLGNCALADCATRRLLELQNWAQQESEQSLPTLLASVLAGRDVLGVEEVSLPPQETSILPPSNLLLELINQDLFTVLMAAREDAFKQNDA